MKRIEAIVRPEKVSDVCRALDTAGHSGVTLSHVEEQGDHQGWVNQVRGALHTVRLSGKVKMEVSVNDDDAERIIQAIHAAAFTSKAGDCRIFVHDTVDAVRIRTCESGAAAL